MFPLFSRVLTWPRISQKQSLRQKLSCRRLTWKAIPRSKSKGLRGAREKGWLTALATAVNDSVPFSWGALGKCSTTTQLGSNVGAFCPPWVLTPHICRVRAQSLDHRFVSLASPHPKPRTSADTLVSPDTRHIALSPPSSDRDFGLSGQQWCHTYLFLKLAVWNHLLSFTEKKRHITYHCVLLWCSKPALHKGATENIWVAVGTGIRLRSRYKVLVQSGCFWHLCFLTKLKEKLTELAAKRFF